MAYIPRILCIDDDENVRLAVTEFLQENKFSVDAVGSGSTAIQLIKSKIYDLVILDIKLKSEDGCELLKKIKKISPTIKVVILTAYPDVDSAVDTLTSGALHYLKKPFNNEEFLAIVKKNCRMESYATLIKDIGKRFRKLRKDKNYTIEQVSERSGISESQISKIENGHNSPSVATMIKIADTLSCHPARFLDLNDELLSENFE